MSRRNRDLLGEIVCHHMVQGINRELIFQEEEEKEKYLSLLKQYYLKYNIDIIAYCIMNNHAHLMLYSSQIQNISNFMQKVNARYAMYYNKRKNRVGYVFRNRFKSKPIINQKQMYTCIKYIHMNPVKANITKEEGKYKYSSYNDYINKTGFLNTRILKFIFNSPENYIKEFKSIEYQNLNFENEKISLKKPLREFLTKEKIKLEQLRNDKVLLQKFICYLISNQYKFSQKELSNILDISVTTIYRRLHKSESES